MSTDTSEKIVDLINEPEVQIMKEGEKDFINVESRNLQEGKFYRVEYEGDVYGIEKQDDGKIILYEVVE
jgi:hypothetical protein